MSGLQHTGLDSAQTFQLESLEPRRLLSGAGAGDMVIQWNDVAIDVLRADTTLPGPTWASRNLAIVQLSVHNAVQAIDRSAETLLSRVRAPATTNMDAAVASAAHAALVRLYPQQQPMLDTRLQQSLATVPDGPGKTIGVQLGQIIAEQVVQFRQRDHADHVVPYTPDGLPGHWEPDPMNPSQTALGPNWPYVKPFSMLDAAQFRPDPPPAMTSDAYYMSLEEVRSLGALNSTTRTPEQTQIGIFWAYDRPGTGAPPALYNQIAQTIAEQQDNTLIENARLFALINVAMADAGVASWDCKYVDNLWRPISGIRRAGEDGNPMTVADPTWMPLGAPGAGVLMDFTPPFPAYVSGHATFGAALFETLENFYGTDQMNFTLTSDELPGVTRSFTSFSQASAENGRSRIYLGIHWNFDDTMGRQVGEQVGQYVFEHTLRPLPRTRGLAPAVPALSVAREVTRVPIAFEAEESSGGVTVEVLDL